MNHWTIAGLVLSSLLLAIGQILFKLAARAAPPVDSWDAAFALMRSPYLWLALVLYGANTILWVLLLQHVPLSRAYVFVALGFILVPASGAVFFGEHLSVPFLIGTLLIVTGILVVSFFST
jgi:multidrug transporter EmrE-like cation transporter